MHQTHTPALRCHRCGATGAQLSVPGAGNSRRVRGVLRDAQFVRCSVCGHSWQSVAREAIERGREAEAQEAAHA